MKLSLKLALAGLLMTVPAQAGVLITPSLFGNSSVMPGDITDFTFFGNPVQFPQGVGSITHNYTSGVANQPTLLTDFIPVVGANATSTYGAQNNTGGTNYNPAYGSIVDPAGSLAKTGIIFQNSAKGSTAPDLVSFILGSGASSFNYSDFTVYVMISNAPGAGLNDIALSAQVEDATDAVGLTPVVTMSITDNTTTVGTATFAQFHITGAASGDVLQLGAVGAGGTSPYLSGVSFKDPVPSPEPSTTAMIVGSLVLLGLGVRQARRATATNV